MPEKDKMIEVIAPYVYPWGDDDAIADALIEAGFGDVTRLIIEIKLLQREIDNLMRTLEENSEVFQKAEHRAEVAEKAFLILWNECKEKLGWNIDCTMWYAKQAKKELAEGKR